MDVLYDMQADLLGRISSASDYSYSSFCAALKQSSFRHMHVTTVNEREDYQQYMSDAIQMLHKSWLSPDEPRRLIESVWLMFGIYVVHSTQIGAHTQSIRINYDEFSVIRSLLRSFDELSCRDPINLLRKMFRQRSFQFCFSDEVIDFCIIPVEKQSETKAVNPDIQSSIFETLSMLELQSLSESYITSCDNVDGLCDNTSAVRASMNQAIIHCETCDKDLTTSVSSQPSSAVVDVIDDIVNQSSTTSSRKLFELSIHHQSSSEDFDDDDDDDDDDEDNNHIGSSDCDANVNGDDEIDDIANEMLLAMSADTSHTINNGNEEASTTATTTTTKAIPLNAQQQRAERRAKMRIYVRKRQDAKAAIKRSSSRKKRIIPLKAKPSSATAVSVIVESSPLLDDSASPSSQQTSKQRHCEDESKQENSTLVAETHQTDFDASSVEDKRVRSEDKTELHSEVAKAQKVLQSIREMKQKLSQDDTQGECSIVNDEKDDVADIDEAASRNDDSMQRILRMRAEMNADSDDDDEV